MRVILEINDRFAIVPGKRFQQLARKIFTLAGRRSGTQKAKTVSISLAMVNDQTMRRLNKKFRARDKTTDVLAFSFLPVTAGKEMFLSVPNDHVADLGEIVISYPQLRRQAKQYESTVTDELRRLFAHGLLHLLGYDHNRTKPRRLMEKLEKLISEKYG